MNALMVFLDGKKTYISGIVLAILAYYGLDTTHGWDLPTISNAVGIAIAAIGVAYGRMEANKGPKAKVAAKRKTRKTRAKKLPPAEANQGRVPLTYAEATAMQNYPVTYTNQSNKAAVEGDSNA